MKTLRQFMEDASFEGDHPRHDDGKFRPSKSVKKATTKTKEKKPAPEKKPSVEKDAPEKKPVNRKAIGDYAKRLKGALGDEREFLKVWDEIVADKKGISRDDAVALAKRWGIQGMPKSITRKKALHYLTYFPHRGSIADRPR